MATLELAKEISFDIHQHQKRFDGSPYINHPLRVMGTVAAQGPFGANPNGSRTA